MKKAKEIKYPKKDDLDLAYLCGVLAGDGSIYINQEKHDYAIRCVCNPKSEKEFYNKIIKNLLLKLFGLKVTPKLYDKGTSYGIGFSSKRLVCFLIDIGLPSGKKYDKLKIPEIFLSKKELTFSFIRGLADTDFCLTLKKGRYPRIIGASKSEQFIDQVYAFLKREGFCPYKQKREYYDKRVNKVEITYSISTSGHKQLINWINKIGFSNSRNINKVREWIDKNPKYLQGEHLKNLLFSDL